MNIYIHKEKFNKNLLKYLTENDLLKNFILTEADTLEDLQISSTEIIIICHASLFGSPEIEQLTPRLNKEQSSIIFFAEILTENEKLLISKRGYDYMMIDPQNKDKEYISIKAEMLCLKINNLQDSFIKNRRLTSYIVDSFSIQVNEIKLQKAYSEIQQLYKHLEEVSKIDPLTNTLNRRAVFDFAQKELKRAFRTALNLNYYINNNDADQRKNKYPYDNEPAGDCDDHFGVFALAILDIDKFKKINDSYGHITGDKVLQKIGAIFQESGVFRESDIIGRYGGDEFIIIFPDTSVQYAMIPLKRFLVKIKAQKIIPEINNEKEKSINISISIGVTACSPDDRSIDDIVHKADIALYHAKKLGGGRIANFEEIEDSEKI